MCGSAQQRVAERRSGAPAADSHESRPHPACYVDQLSSTARGSAALDPPFPPPGPRFLPLTLRTPRPGSGRCAAVGSKVCLHNSALEPGFVCRGRSLAR
eukprot:2277117-Pleurochrysis_carterae.AAC.3